MPEVARSLQYPCNSVIVWIQLGYYYSSFFLIITWPINHSLSCIVVTAHWTQFTIDTMLLARNVQSYNQMHASLYKLSYHIGIDLDMPSIIERCTSGHCFTITWQWHWIAFPFMSVLSGWLLIYAYHPFDEKIHIPCHSQWHFWWEALPDRSITLSTTSPVTGSCSSLWIWSSILNNIWFYLRANMWAFGPMPLCFVSFHYGKELTEWGHNEPCLAQYWDGW